MAAPNTHFERNDVLMELLRQISDPNSSITDTQVVAICAAVSTESPAFFKAFNEVNAAASGNVIPTVNTVARAMRSHADSIDTAVKSDEVDEITPDESEEDKAVQKPLLPQSTTEQTELLPGDLDFTGSVYETLFQCQSEVKSGVYLVNDGPLKRRNIMKQSFNPNRWGLTDLDHEIRSLRKEQPEVDITGQIAALLDYCPFTLRHQLCVLKHNCPLHKICGANCTRPAHGTHPVKPICPAVMGGKPCTHPDCDKVHDENVKRVVDALCIDHATSASSLRGSA